MSDADRFWSKVDRSGGPDACWPWLFAVDKDGYGKFQTGSKGHQKHHRAHRFAFALTNDGASPPVVLHHCDNEPCCNPVHLLGGTQTDNRADCTAKGRNAVGEHNGSRTHPPPRGELSALAKLTDRQVEEIRARYIRRRGVSALATKYGIHPATVSAIANRGYRK